MRNERTYANFLSLSHDGYDVRWPVWVDTSVTLLDGEQVTVPMGHSHHAWRISGPDVDARVMFYPGTSGAGFFAQTDTRPSWTGLKVRDAGTDGARVIQTLDLATRYLRRLRTEREGVASGYSDGGAGFLGGCNDSNAVLEYLTMGSITAFPLMRAASLDAQPALGDGLDAVVRRLPHDADVAPDRADGLRRILEMTPLDVDSPLLPDDALRAQLRSVSEEVLGY